MFKCRVYSFLPQNASSALKHFLLSRVYAKAAQLNMAADILASDVREVTLGALDLMIPSGRARHVLDDGRRRRDTEARAVSDGLACWRDRLDRGCSDSHRHSTDHRQ